MDGCRLGSRGRLLRIGVCRGRGRCCRYAEEPWFCSAPVVKAPHGPLSEISTASQARGSGGCAHISGNSARVRSKRLRLPTAHVVERCKCRPSPMAWQMRRASESSLVSHGGAVSHTGDTVSRRPVGLSGHSENAMTGSSCTMAYGHTLSSKSSGWSPSVPDKYLPVNRQVGTWQPARVGGRGGRHGTSSLKRP